MLTRLKPEQKTEFKNKKFRTDKLIQSQIDYILLVENELNNRFEKSSNLSFLTNSNANEFDADLDYDITDLKDLIISDLSDEHLIKLYNNNLIKYFVLKKLNSELEFSRVKLQLSTRTQINLEKIRKRVGWLEAEIEKIVEPITRLSREKKNFLRKQKSILIEKQLDLINQIEKTEKKVLKESPIEPEKSPVIPSEFREEIIFKWEKSSNGSTDSLLNTPDSSILDDESPTELLMINQNQETDEKIKKSVPESPKCEDYQTETDQKTEHLDILIKDNQSFEVINPIEHFIKSPSLIIRDKDEKNEKLEKKEVKQVKNNKLESLISEHNRFDLPDYSKTIISLNSSSYHRLPLAITTSYISIDDAKVIDGQVPYLQEKKNLEKDEIDLLKIASDLKSLSKEICSTTQLSLKKNDSIISYFDVGIDEDLTKPLLKLKPKIAKKTYLPPPFLPPKRLPLKIHKKKLQSKSQWANIDELKDNYKKSRLINLHDLKKQTEIQLNAINMNKDEGVKKPKFKNNESFENIKYPTFTWNELKPDNLTEGHSGPKFERIKKLEAIRHLGLLQVGDGSTVYTLCNIVENIDENELIRYEAAKSLILLGFWNCFLINYLINKLKSSSHDIKIEILECIIRGKFCTVMEDLSLFPEFIKTLENLVDVVNLDIAQKACLCIGQLGNKNNQKAINKLIKIYECSEDENKKTLSLESLVRLFCQKDGRIIQFLIKTVEYAKNWIARISAVKLLSYIGINILIANNFYDQVYTVLLDRLSSDPIKDVRLKIGDSIRDLQMFDMAFNSIAKQLEHNDEEIRAKSVISIEMLAVRKKKIIQNLIDMLELDSSELVRKNVLKALGNLAPQNPRVIQAFNNLEKSSKIYKYFVNLN